MNIFKQFYKSIYSPKDIAIFRFQGIGKTILYVFFLTFISILPSIYYFSYSVSTGVNTVREVLKGDLPQFSIKNGQLNVKTNVPITIRKYQFTIFMDPTGAVSEKEVQDEGNAFAFLKNEFVLAAGGNIQTYPYSMLQGNTITKNDFLQFINTLDGLRVIIIPVISVLVFLFSSAAAFIKVTVLALIGLAFKNIMKRNLQYRHLWRLAAYSVTLPTVFFTIMAAVKTSVPNGYLLNWVVSVIVLYLALNEVPRPKKAV